MTLSKLEQTAEEDAKHPFYVSNGEGVSLCAGFNPFDALDFFHAYRQRGYRPSIIRNGKVLHKC